MPKLLIDANISYRIKRNLFDIFDDVVHVSDLTIQRQQKIYLFGNMQKKMNI